MKFEVTMVGTVTVTPEYEGEVFDHDEIVERTFDRTMAELTKLANIHDPSVSGTITTGEIEVSVVVEAEDFIQAIQIGDPAIRTAFHAADTSTEGWDDVPLPLRVQWHRVEADDLVDA